MGSGPPPPTGFLDPQPWDVGRVSRVPTPCRARVQRVQVATKVEAVNWAVKLGSPQSSLGHFPGLFAKRNDLRWG